MKIIIARIYVTEGAQVHEKIFQKLHDESKVKGVTMFRGIAGFGKSGVTHSSSLLDMSFDLPVVIEFFDSEEKVELALKSIVDLVSPEHVVTQAAELN